MKHTRLTALAVAVTVGAVGPAPRSGRPAPASWALRSSPAEPSKRRTATSTVHHKSRHRRVEIELQQPSDAIVQQVTIAPGGSTGWHSHPGPAIVIVKSGSLTLYDGDDRRCKGTSYTANPATPLVGKVFVDEGRGHVHIGRNEGTTNAELYVTYLDVPVGAEPRIDVPHPGNCPF